MIDTNIWKMFFNYYQASNIHNACWNKNCSIFIFIIRKFHFCFFTRMIPNVFCFKMFLPKSNLTWSTSQNVYFFSHWFQNVKIVKTWFVRTGKTVFITSVPFSRSVSNQYWLFILNVFAINSYNDLLSLIWILLFIFISVHSHECEYTIWS